VAAVRGDRFILRRPSPGQTMGGGRVLDPNPGRQHRRFKAAVVARLQTLLQGTPAELLLQALQRNEPATEAEVTKRAGLDSETAKGAWAELTDSKQIVVVGKQVISNIKWQALMDEVTVSLNGFHQSSPLRLGMSREELRSRLKVPAFLFNQLLSDHPNIEERQAVVAVAGHGVVFSAEQEKKVAELMKGMENAGINTPTVKQNKALVGDDVYFALLDLGQLQPISDDVVYTQTQYTAVRDQIIGYLTQHNTITASQVRDLLDTSRKYAIAWLEHLDQQKITRRVGDERELIRKY
jgi:selenocysteine-specific elongation factor